MEDLIKRIEEADGPDRELDAEIACLIGKPLGNVCHWLHGEDIPYQPTAYGYYVAVIPEYDGGTRTSEPFASREFTSSIDAAMTLVPEGWGYQIMPLFCVLRHPESSYYNTSKDIEAHGKTPALALCAAALRASSSLK